MIRALVNGVSSGAIPVADRAVQYGDGVFETIAVREGEAELWPQHIERLTRGCRGLGIGAPNPVLLAREAGQLIRDEERCVLKIVVSRGTGGRGYRSPEHSDATRILSLHPWPDWPQALWHEGVEVRICTTPLGRNPRLAGIKHLNRLEQVLARSEWRDIRIPEGLMLDTEGVVVEGTMSNLFLVRNGVVQTPDLSRCGVAGIMRERVILLARELGMAVREGEYRLDDLQGADELFLTNSLVGIWPVHRVGARCYRSPGEITRELQQKIEQIRIGFSL